MTLLFVFFFYLFSSVQAQERLDLEHYHITIIGISEYPYAEKLTHIPNAKQDCYNAHDFFTKKAKLPKENVRSLCGTNATQDEIFDFLYSSVENLTEKDHLTIFWLGHGVRGGEFTAFLPADAYSLDDVNQRYIFLEDMSAIIQTRTNTESSVLLVTNTSHIGKYNYASLNGPTAEDFASDINYGVLSSKLPQPINDSHLFLRSIEWCWSPKVINENQYFSGTNFFNCFQKKMDTAISSSNIGSIHIPQADEINKEVSPVVVMNDEESEKVKSINQNPYPIEEMRNSLVSNKRNSTKDTISTIALSTASVAMATNISIIYTGIRERKRLNSPLKSYKDKVEFEQEYKEYKTLQRLNFALYAITGIGIAIGTVTFQPQNNGLKVMTTF